MPVQSCSNNGNPGYKWGEQGACYTYPKGNLAQKKKAKRKAFYQGLASGEASNFRKSDDKKEIESILKSLTEWFEEKWVDISRPKPGGGFEPCGRGDADTGKYPKCVPAARAARMTPEQIASAVRRKRRAESTETRDGKKPINVSTEKAATRNIPTNPALYARVKAEAKAKFDVYPSAYANAWLVREYKKRGGGYRTVSKSIDISKIAEDLAQEEAMLADALLAIATMYGKFNEDESGIWAGYDSPEENEVKDIGVKCSNCVLYEGNGVCKIIAQQVEDEGKCRFAVIPDGVVQDDDLEMDEEYEDDEEDDDEMINGYPAATQDISINLANRQNCIDSANYGPMNPAIDNAPFWQAKADIFNTTIEEAKTALCGNCAAFVQTTKMKEAIAIGLGGEEEAYAIMNMANLGYCEIYDFKCAATRTCDAWVVGGPLTDNNSNVTKFDLLRYIIEGLSPFGTDSDNKEIK
jgi:hypothetical protein